MISFEFHSILLLTKSIDKHRLVVLNHLESFTCIYPIEGWTLLYFLFFTEKK
jgi:hypothetical protein